MTRTMIAAQGEVRVYKIDAIPEGIVTRDPERNHNGAAIISHSEQGHHHVVAGAEVIERINDLPEGMKIFYAIVDNPTALEQDAPHPHGLVPLDAGSIYEFRTAREFNPFLEEIRRVTD